MVLTLSKWQLGLLCSLRHARHYATKYAHSLDKTKPVTIDGAQYNVDEFTNVTPKILTKVGRGLHNQKNHPLNLIKRRIENYFYKAFANRMGNPLFAIFDNISPVVTMQQNFDSLLIPPDHVSRKPSDTYYVNKDYLLRCHTSAHQSDLMNTGLDAFLVMGDVYRRDEVDTSHYPVFHQCEGVRLFTDHQLFDSVQDKQGLKLFEKGHRDPSKQEVHTMAAARLVEHDLKAALVGLTTALFGPDIEYQWVDQYFPFTHPSWELEVKYQGKWLEVLGCGIMEQQILDEVGADNKVGWAFGLGLERLAMRLYDIPDIRLFWSTDDRILSQFNVTDPETPIQFKPVSFHPGCHSDMSFWIAESFSPNDYYDLVRSVGGDLVEQISLIDSFTQPGTRRISHCYRLVYRHMERALSQDEVNELHSKIADTAHRELNVELR